MLVKKAFILKKVLRQTLLISLFLHKNLSITHFLHVLKKNKVLAVFGTLKICFLYSTVLIWFISRQILLLFHFRSGIKVLNVHSTVLTVFGIKSDTLQLSVQHGKFTWKTLSMLYVSLDITGPVYHKRKPLVLNFDWKYASYTKKHVWSSWFVKTNKE